MLRDDMGLQKKEMQTARADISNAATVTSNLDGRFQLLDGELRGLSKKLTDHQAARDKAAANKSSSVMPVRSFRDHIHTRYGWYHSSV